MVNSADPDQLASSEANRSRSTLFAKAGYIRVQQEMSLKAQSTLLRSCWASHLNYSHFFLGRLSPLKG